MISHLFWWEKILFFYQLNITFNTWS